MSYWWVNQGNSYRLEHSGGFIWAPTVNADGQTFFHWENLANVQEGDVIFSNVDGRIKAIGIALNDAYLAEKSSGHANLWLDAGRRVDIKYYDVSQPMTIAEIFVLTSAFWPKKYAPITNKGDRANQGYLFSVPYLAGEAMLDLLSFTYNTSINRSNNEIDITTKDAVVKARVGQGQFRKDLIERWSSKCSITHFPILSLLTASHIKPWALSNNNERLDPDNGLLLSPNYNSLFDRFLISFSENGELIKSIRISWEDLNLLNIDPTARLKGLNKGNKQYLSYHLEVMLSKKL